MCDPWPLAKHGDERQQEDRKRNHPEEWSGSNIGRHIRRNGDD
jgi:hypothetical protein